MTMWVRYTLLNSSTITHVHRVR